MNLARFEGSYYWHKHDADELFHVVEGEISIGIRGQADIVLRAGQWAVIPAGTIHCPRSDVSSVVLMIEPEGMSSERCK